MKKKHRSKILGTVGVFFAFSASLIFVALNFDKFTFTPWIRVVPTASATYASGNAEFKALILNSEKTVAVLRQSEKHGSAQDEERQNASEPDGTPFSYSATEELVFAVNSRSFIKKNFSVAKFVELDEDNNLYLFDMALGGAYQNSVERILKYSPSGKFLGELYNYTYTNKLFLNTKGKIAGMHYFDGKLYVIRLEKKGFYLETLDTATATHGGGTNAKRIEAFFDYPDALQNLLYAHINAERRRIVLTSKPGRISQYDFDGDLLFSYHSGENTRNSPYTAVTDDNDDILYADIFTGEICKIETGFSASAVDSTPAFDTPSINDLAGSESFSGLTGFAGFADFDDSADPDDPEDPDNFLDFDSFADFADFGADQTLYQTDKMCFYRINYNHGKLFASSYNETRISFIEERDLHPNNSIFTDIDFYSFASPLLRIAVFVAVVFDALVIIVAIVLILRKTKPFTHITSAHSRIAFAAVCIMFGAVISTVLIVNEIQKLYIDKAYREIENISTLVTATIDTDILEALDSSSQYESPDYLALKESLFHSIEALHFSGERFYQIIWMQFDDTIYLMYDTESSTGLFFPFAEYDGFYKEVMETKISQRQREVTSEGSWFFSCGPIVNPDGKVIALLETGYELTSILATLRQIVIQTILIVISAAIALFLIIQEVIIIFEALHQNTLEQTTKLRPKFHPEILRAFTFLMFLASNIAMAFLPMYAADLYIPIFSLPKEIAVTLPFVFDMVFTAVALVVVPSTIKKMGLKSIGFVAAILFALGNALCFSATNIIFLTLGYMCNGFAGGAMLLVINTIIGAQKEVESINSGFAHFNASYLGGMNVGIIIGSILAQFFEYRMVFLFSTITALFLFLLFNYAMHSKTLFHIFELPDEKTAEEEIASTSLLTFVCKPAVFATLLLALVPYVISTSFTSYFMPLFGTANGLHESNIGQLILLSGLFAILFGTALCAWAGKKLPTRVIVVLTLIVNFGAIYLFSLNVSVQMMILTVVLLALANIFALTNIQTYYAILYAQTSVSPTKALSLYSATENIAMAIGPVVFSYLLARNIASGMKLFALISFAAMLLFVFITALSARKPTQLAVAPENM
ncbi:MAG: hypothetical protein Ta2A_01930 [Treponemataceae bacterium]|nr:MAG: hypothetical protein Ta2A_01930 [Treponemataceae bacterium]